MEPFQHPHQRLQPILQLLPRARWQLIQHRALVFHVWHHGLLDQRLSLRRELHQLAAGILRVGQASDQALLFQALQAIMVPEVTINDSNSAVGVRL